jgi:hypothetical protein
VPISAVILSGAKDLLLILVFDPRFAKSAKADPSLRSG